MSNILEVMLAVTADDDPECPECTSQLIDVSGGHLHPDDTLSYDCVCHNCGNEWREQHTLPDIHPDMPYFPCTH